MIHRRLLTRHVEMPLPVPCSIWAGLLCTFLGVLACGEPSSLAPSPVDDDVERDAWVDVAARVSGDGDTRFVSGRTYAERRGKFWLGSESNGEDSASNPTAFDRGRVYGLSRYIGLVITDQAQPAPTRVEGKYPLQGVPFALSVQDGVALAILNGAPSPPCATGACSTPIEALVTLIDARDPGAPRWLADRRVTGTITATHRIGDTLFVLSRDFAACGECIGNPSERSAQLTAISLADPLALTDLEQLTLPAPDVVRAYHFEGARLYVATQDDSVQIIELEGGLRLGPSAPLAGVVFRDEQLRVDAGVLRAGLFTPPDATIDAEFRIDAAGLVPIEPVVFAAPNGERVEPLFHSGSAFGLANGGRTLISFDLTEREAPRAVGGVALPFRAEQLVGTHEDELVALGAFAAVRLALIDVQALGAPSVQGDISWGQPLSLWGTPRFDAATNLMLVPYSQGSDVRVQIVSTAGGTLALGADFSGGIDMQNYAIEPARVGQMRDASLGVYDATARGGSTLALARPADSLRISGDRLLRFVENADAELLPLAPADPQTREGTSINRLLELSPSSAWLPWAHRRDAQLYLAQLEQAPQGIRDQGVLAIYGFDVSAPDSAVVTGHAVLPPALERDHYLDLIQTQRSAVVARGSITLQDYGTDVDLALDEVPTLGFEVLDLSTPAAPRAGAHIDIPLDLIAGNFARWPKRISIDTADGWRWFARGAPLVVSGEVLVSQHTERVDDAHERVFLDRLDLSEPDAPRLFPSVNIPGVPIAFDAASGELITLEALRFEERADSESECEGRGYGASYYPPYDRDMCVVIRRALNALTVSGDVATRNSQLLLDSGRRTLAFAVSGATVYYITEPALNDEQAAEVYSTARLDGVRSPGVEVTLERVCLNRGQLERLPSLDVSALHPTSPRDWTLFARGGRAFTRTGNVLGVIDVESETPSVRSVALPIWGCRNIEVAGDRLYCAGGPAGLQIINLESAQAP